ncbi:FAD-binding oxidoreductase [Mumia sp. zg.B21]|uniref:FAD-binding oxidoreductase n=1 Tax=Mumia sp. zg.B21 TaxID=2855447 RepID=UPI001C6F47C3|nr:FAD-binding oxidoreductase [Mumia sp. zg.B21]MBW9210802.1 FAD-binding oxidoreductase [Mumia sp. zg.B21]
MTDYSTLADRLTGTLTTRDEPDHTAGATAFNLTVQHDPDAVVHAATEEDVLQTVRFAAAEGVPIHLHTTGHGAHAAYETGILLALGGLSSVAIDPAARTAKVGGGTRWADVVAAAAEHGLAPVTGSSTNVGVVGFLVGGGLGPLARSHGFGSDHVVSARVVTGNGEVVDASSYGDTELYWALRGGKTGLGVVTEITLALAEVPSLYAGTLFFDLEESTEPYARWLDWTTTAPTDVTTSGLIVGFPDLEVVPSPMRGKHLFALHVAYPGPEDDGAALSEPLRELGSVYLDDLGPLPLADVARITNDPTQPGPSFLRGATLTHVDRDFAEAVLALAGPGSDLPIMGLEVRHVGAATAVETSETDAVGFRDFDYTLTMLGAPDPALFGEVLPSVFARVEETVAPWRSPHLTPNWMADPRDPDEEARTWPAGVRARLAAVRAAYDPAHVFQA